MKQTTNFRKNLLILLLTLCTTYGFANSTGEVNREIKASFRQDFHNAQLMTIEVRNNFTKLTFKMNDQVMSAFYSGSGELLAVTRNILSSQLPVSLLNSLKKYYNNSWITDLFEFNGDNQDCYYITLENADTKLTLRSNDGSWEVYSSRKK